MYDILCRYIIVFGAVFIIYWILDITGITQRLPIWAQMTIHLTMLVLCLVLLISNKKVNKRRKEFEQLYPDIESCIQREKISEIGADSHKGVKE